MLEPAVENGSTVASRLIYTAVKDMTRASHAESSSFGGSNSSLGLRYGLAGVLSGVLVAAPAGWIAGRVAPVAAPAASASAAEPCQPRPTDPPTDPRVARIHEVERALRSHDWVGPRAEVLRRTFAELQRHAQGDRRVDELRREAAERLLADAVTLGYAGDEVGARERIQLALELVPDQPGARAMLADLEQPAADAGRSAPGHVPDGFELAPQPTRQPSVVPPGEGSGGLVLPRPEPAPAPAPPPAPKDHSP